MSVLVPPPRWRLRFWLIGMRLPIEYRAWVYQQVTKPGYLRRRRRAVLLIQVVCIVVPQALTAVFARSPSRGILPGFLLLLFVFAALRSRSVSEAQWQRVLAYHGLAPDGHLIEPLSPWRDNPLGRVGVALLAAQVLLFASGVAVVFDHVNGCDAVPASSVAAIRAAVGVQRPAAFGKRPSFPGIPDDPPPYDVAVNSPLLSPRQVGTPFDGLAYVSAYVRDRHGRRIGPAVWRVIQPYTSLQTFELTVGAEDVVARRLTPNIGASFGSPPDPLIGKARSCVRWSD